MMRKTIWIDLDNAPHVPFFMPLVRHLRQEGHRLGEDDVADEVAEP